MRKITWVLSFLFALGNITATFAQTITFESLKIDYGKIAKGANGVRELKFTNTGTAPLVISDAKSFCACLVAIAPKEPIMSGESGVIIVRYDTNRVGTFEKYVMLTTNGAENKQVGLTVRGEVLPN